MSSIPADVYPHQTADTRAFKIQVSDYPDVLELGTGTAANNENYRFINLGLDVKGPSNLFETMPETRSAVLLANSKNALVVFNALGSDIADQNAANTAMASTTTGLAIDGLAYASKIDPNDIGTDGLGLYRKQTQITHTTVTGDYTLRFFADSIEEVVKIRIVDAKPKIFIMSNSTNTDGNYQPFEGNSGLALFSTKPELLKYYDAAANKDDDTTAAFNYRAVSKTVGGLFAQPVNGVYVVEKPATLVAGRHIFYSKIGVADLAVGAYDYKIIKEYPDGRVETTQDKAFVTSVDYNQLAVFDTRLGFDNAKFTTNWIIDEPAYELGTYKYTFTIGATTKQYVINVVDLPSLDVVKLSVGSNELNLFNTTYRALITASVNQLVGQVNIEFNLNNLLASDYYYVSAAQTSGSNIVIEDAKSAANPSVAADYLPLKDLNKLTLADLVNGARVVGNELTFTFKFYRPIKKATEGSSGFEFIGEQEIIIIGDN
jgi:hypothetical protein